MNRPPTTRPGPARTARPVTWAGLLARLRASVGLRRLVPTGPALVATDLLCDVSLRVRPARLTAAAALLDPIVAHTPAEADIAGVARRFVAARARGWELTWRPWELARIPIHGEQRLRAARDTGRGVLVSHSHLGPLGGWIALTGVLGPLLYPGDWLLDDPDESYNGYQVRHWERIFRDAGVELMHHVGAAPRVYRVLRRGGAVLMTMDAPGGRPTEFLGKPVELDDGTARLAVKADALVVPVTLLPAGRRWEIHVGDVLDPRDFPGPDELHVTLVRLHERSILRHPEHMEPPAPWIWGSATRDGWRR